MEFWKDKRKEIEKGYRNKSKNKGEFSRRWVTKTRAYRKSSSRYSNSFHGIIFQFIFLNNYTLDDFKSADSRLSISSKVSSQNRKELLEDYLSFRDNLKLLFNVIIDEIWKFCHTQNEDFTFSSFHSEKVVSKKNELINNKRKEKKNKLLPHRKFIKPKVNSHKAKD